MLNFSQQPTPRGGLRLVVQESSADAAISAEIGPDQDPLTMAVYWRGRVNLDEMVSFFAENCPPATVPSFGALMFTLNDRVRVEGVSSLTTVVRRMPPKARFVRLEHADAGGGRATANDFVLWSRIDLESIPRGEPAPDLIAVCAPPNWLNAITNPLSEFVSNTHIRNLPREAALASVRRLLHNSAVPSLN